MQDDCGAESDLGLWARLINTSGSKPIMIENCHWGRTLPNSTWCPFNFFRSSGDISVGFGSAVKNLMTQLKPNKAGTSPQSRSRPGCWAYPDNLVVGATHWHAHPLNDAEARTHFASWCITSSPLILSLDVRNQTAMDLVWPIISNKEAIAVNQQWAGYEQQGWGYQQ